MTPSNPIMPWLDVIEKGSSILFGNDSSTTVTGTSNTIQDMLATMTQDSSVLQQLQELSSQSSAETTTGQQQTLPAELMAILTSLSQGVGGTIEGALQDRGSAEGKGTQLSADAMSAAIQEVIAGGIGNVAELGSNAGAYDSTVQGEAGARLGAEAAKSGANVRLQAIMGQQQLEQQDLQNLIAGLTSLTGTAKGGLTETTGTATGDVTGTRDQTSSQDTSTTSTQAQTTDTATDSTTENVIEEEGLWDKLFG